MRSIPQCNSFIQAISLAPIQVHYYSEALLTTTLILCWSFTLKRHRHLRVKNLPKVPTWRLEQDSNPRPFRRKASSSNEPSCPNYVPSGCATAGRPTSPNSEK